MDGSKRISALEGKNLESSIFETKAFKGITAALVALALVGGIYAGIKTGIFSAAIHYATMNPLITGGILVTITLVVGAVALWVVFGKEKDSVQEIKHKNSLQPINTLFQVSELSKKIQNFTLEERNAYLQNLEYNLSNDGFHDMDAEQKREVELALVEVNIEWFDKCNISFIGGFQTNYAKANKLFSEMKEIDGIESHVHIACIEVYYKNCDRLSGLMNDSYMEGERQYEHMPFEKKAQMLLSTRLTKFTLPAKSKSSEKAAILVNLAEVDLDAFRTSKIDKTKFAKEYRTVICGNLKALSEGDGRDIYYYYGCWLLALRTADKLDAIAKSN